MMVSPAFLTPFLVPSLRAVLEERFSKSRVVTDEERKLLHR
jgi:hypothetical protein